MIHLSDYVVATAFVYVTVECKRCLDLKRKVTEMGINDFHEENFGIDELVNTFHVLCEHVGTGVAAAKEFFESEQVQSAIDVCKEIDGVAEDSLKAYGMFRKVISIPTKLYLRKLDRYFKGLIDIPQEKREKYITVATKETVNKETVFILEIVNRIEDIEKIDILVKLFELRLDGLISKEEFIRMMIMTTSTVSEDLKYMHDNVCQGSFKITGVQEEGLLLAGWLIYDGMSMADAEDENINLYRYTQNAVKYCELVWGVRPSDNSTVGSIKFVPSEVSEDAIADMFK